MVLHEFTTLIMRINHVKLAELFMAKHYQRTHVNTIAKWLLLTYAFETLGMIRVQFKTDEENVISQKAIERLGATKEGIVTK